MDEVIMDVPIALQQLIKSNNQLLKEYQAVLWKQIENANTQMMQILRLDPAIGWKLDMDRMVYVRMDTNTTDTSTADE